MALDSVRIQPFLNVPRDLREWTKWINEALVTALATLTATDISDATTAGRAMLTAADAAAQRVLLALGTAALKNTGTSGDVVPLANGANTWSAAQTFAAAPVFSVPFPVPSYTVAGVPSAAVAGKLAYISNETGGAVLAFSDGTDWRRVTDRAVIS